jgi:hypothetical protein
MGIKTSTQKYKDKNSNYKIKVSSATVAKLRKGTKAGNIAAAKAPGASAEYKEAVRRFYGKGSVGGTSTPSIKQVGPIVDKKPYVPKIDRSNPKPSQAQMDRAKKNNAAKKASAITATRSEQKKPTMAQMDRAKRARIAGQAGAIKATRNEPMPKKTDRLKPKPIAKKPMGSKIKTLQRKGI